MSPWKRNVWPIWLSQFLSIMGFAFAMPFAPYFMQELGVPEGPELYRWLAIYGAATPLTLFISAPIWGILADRYGRRMMLLRANLGAAVILALMAVVRDVQGLIVLRLMQGVFTGTMTAAVTMVAVRAPREQSGIALGTLSAAVFAGIVVGQSVGGFLADAFGYRFALMISGWILMVAACIVVFATREDEDIGRNHVEHASSKEKWSYLRVVLPILVLTGFTCAIRQFDGVIFPVLVQEIHGSLGGVSRWMGLIGAVAAVAAGLSGVILGRLSDRVSVSRVAWISAVGAAVLLASHSIANSFVVLFPLRYLVFFCAGSLDPMFQAALARNTPDDRRGIVFGLAGSAKSLGWMVAPLMSGMLASAYGLRFVFVVGGILYLLLAVAILVVGPRIDARGETKDDLVAAKKRSIDKAGQHE